MKQRKFLIEFTLEQKHLDFLAQEESLSIEQLTDDKITEILSKDLKEFFHIPVRIMAA